MRCAAFSRSCSQASCEMPLKWSGTPKLTNCHGKLNSRDLVHRRVLGGIVEPGQALGGVLAGAPISGDRQQVDAI